MVKVTVCARRLAIGMMPTGYASHVAVLIGNYFCEFGPNGVSCTFIKNGQAPPLWRIKAAGETSVTQDQIEKFNANYDKNYRMFGANANNCQIYAIKLLEYLDLNGGVVNDLLDSIDGDF